MSLQRLSIALSALALAGCGLTPYQRPSVDVPQAWRSEAQTDRSLVERPWGELFADAELNALVETALAQNRDLRIAAERIELARARYGIERSFLFPSVLADAAYTRQRQPAAGLDKNPTSSVTSIGVAVPTWEIDLWGRVRAATQVAYRDLLASTENRRAFEVSLVAEVSNAYLALLELDAQIETALRTVETRKESLRVVQSRFDGGIVSAADLMQAQSNLAVAERTVVLLQGQRLRAENGLSVLLGRNPGAIARARKLGDYPATPALPAGIPSQLLERRPDILAAEQQLIGSQANIDAARKAYFPAISLTGFLGFASPEIKELFEGDRFAWSVTPAITAPIFTAGRLRSNVEAAQAQQRIALDQYLGTIQNAFREVDDALSLYDQSRKEREALERVVNANRERLRLADLRYRGGVTIYLEVLLAEQDLFDSELQLVQVTRSVYSSVVQLYAALGGGWQAGALAPAPSSSAAAPSAAVPAAQGTGAQSAATSAPSQQVARASSASRQDSVEVGRDGADTIVNVYYGRGIGGTLMKAPASGWPATVMVRLHGFRELESFTARAGNASLACGLARPEAQPAVQSCQLDGSEVEALRRTGSIYEVTLPRTLLDAADVPVEMRWVDYSR
jgi:multidrug efflux system outer membrane protein